MLEKVAHNDTRCTISLKRGCRLVQHLRLSLTVCKTAAGLWVLASMTRLMVERGFAPRRGSQLGSRNPLHSAVVLLYCGGLECQPEHSVRSLNMQPLYCMTSFAYYLHHTRPGNTILLLSALHECITPSPLVFKATTARLQPLQLVASRDIFAFWLHVQPRRM